MQKVWFITGSSRGLGRSLTEAVLADGDLVAATARKPEQLNDLIEKYSSQLLLIALDVTDYQQVKKAVADTLDKFGRIDVLVNNAGFGITGAAEAFTDEQVRSQLETNLYAPIEITRMVLPIMRKQRSGRILQISSIGGRITSVGLSVYQSAKHGLSGFSDALAKEVAPLGIKVTSVEPGAFKTDWAGDSMSFAQQVEGYESTVDARVTAFKTKNFTANGSPDKAAKVLLDLAKHPDPPLHLLLGTDALAVLQKSDDIKKSELEKWRSVSESTDEN